jgi:hypothetical protein
MQQKINKNLQTKLMSAECQVGGKRRENKEKA